MATIYKSRQFPDIFEMDFESCAAYHCGIGLRLGWTGRLCSITRPWHGQQG